MKPTLTIFGAGKVGQVLGLQFFKHQVFAVQDVLTRSMRSSVAACDFIGAGRPVDDISELRPADVVMIAVPDDQIRACALQLQERGLIQHSTITFHCSGALGAAELGIKHGAASVHPMRSFADLAQVAAHFSNTICSLEGDAYATKVLTHALRQIEAQVATVSAEGKSLYHAAAVFASNYLVTIIDASLVTFEAAGISPEMARRMAEPLARETFENIFRLGTRSALTGPIARGDMQTVQRHQDALKKWNPGMAALYTELAAATKNMKERDLPDSG